MTTYKKPLLCGTHIRVNGALYHGHSVHSRSRARAFKIHYASCTVGRRAYTVSLSGARFNIVLFCSVVNPRYCSSYHRLDDFARHDRTTGWCRLDAGRARHAAIIVIGTGTSAGRRQPAAIGGRRYGHRTSGRRDSRRATGRRLVEWHKGYGIAGRQRQDGRDRGRDRGTGAP